SIVFWADLLADSWSYLTECIRTGDTAAGVRPEGVPSGRRTRMRCNLPRCDGHGARGGLHAHRARVGLLAIPRCRRPWRRARRADCGYSERLSEREGHVS